ncbi:LysM peptidoglycan-binding domain-containing protein [Candidatus Gracilibacteria bacterium 28_42_T64]|nr:LysM peptidoglycan-binding domain-containing protein [Candidatus Gracilibacteria bacterium 28_42_T64]
MNILTQGSNDLKNINGIGKISQKINAIKNGVIASALSIVMLGSSLVHASKGPDQSEQPTNNGNDHSLSLKGKENEAMFYTVQKDDIWGRIAEKFDIPLADLSKMNPGFQGREDKIYPNEQIRIRKEGFGVLEYIVGTSDEDGLFAIAIRHNMTNEEIIKLNPQIANINKIEIGDIIYVKESVKTLPSEQIAQTESNSIQTTQIQTVENESNETEIEPIQEKLAGEDPNIKTAELIFDAVNKGKRKFSITTNRSLDINQIIPENIFVVKVINGSYATIAYRKAGIKEFFTRNEEPINMTKGTKLRFFTMEDLLNKTYLSNINWYESFSEEKRFEKYTTEQNGYFAYKFPDEEVLNRSTMHEVVPPTIMAMHIKGQGWVHRNNSTEAFTFLNKSKKGRVKVYNNTEVRFANTLELRKIELANLGPVERYQERTQKEKLAAHAAKGTDGTITLQFKNKEVESIARLDEIIPASQQYLTLQFKDEMELVRRNATTGKFEYENEFIPQRPLIFNQTKIALIKPEEYLASIQERERSYAIAHMDEEYITHHHKSLNDFGSCGTEHRNIKMGLNKNHKIPVGGMHGYKYEEYYEQLVKDGYFIKVYVGIPRNAKGGASLVYAQTNIIDSLEGNKEECGVENKVKSKRTDREKCGHVETKIGERYHHGPWLQDHPGGSINGNSPKSGFKGYAYYPTQKLVDQAGENSFYAKVIRKESNIIAMTKASIRAINAVKSGEVTPEILASTYSDAIEDPFWSEAVNKLFSNTTKLNVIARLGTVINNRGKSQDPVDALREYRLENVSLAGKAKTLDDKIRHKKIANALVKIIRELKGYHSKEKAAHTLAQASI